MSHATENWVYDSGNVNESDRRALAKAKNIEKRFIENGYRWYSVSNQLKVLVPYDEDGNPTPLALRMIARQKELLGIK